MQKKTESRQEEKEEDTEYKEEESGADEVDANNFHTDNSQDLAVEI